MEKEMPTFRQKVHRILQNHSETFGEATVQQFLLWLIVLNVFFAVIETVPGNQFFHFFNRWFLVFSFIVFTIEYIARLWTATLNKGVSTAKDVFLYALSPMMVLDFFIIAPFYLSLFFPLILDWVVIFRLLRIFRAIRLIKYTKAFNRIASVIRKEKEELATVLLIMLVMLTISSTLLYVFERNVPNTQFTSIPATFWWGVATLTTIGYGDMVPVTIMGKIFGSFTAVLGVGLFALPTGLLGASFYQDVSRSRESQIKKMQEQIGFIQTHTEEKEEKFEQSIERHKRKIQKLEDELAEAKKELEEEQMASNSHSKKKTKK